ncbi:hypothetical protein STEG23_021396 [Scotinomys teguina]
MELSTDYLREKLRRDLEAEHVEVEDTTFNRCATSFRVLVVSAKFEGKPLLQRHRRALNVFSRLLLNSERNHSDGPLALVFRASVTTDGVTTVSSSPYCQGLSLTLHYPYFHLLILPSKRLVKLES